MREVKLLGTVESGILYFVIRGDRGIASAEVSQIWDDGSWEFNRLFVPKELRGEGCASLLVGSVVEFFKENCLKLRCGINAYGDLNFDQLKAFYLRHGFVETDTEEIVVLP